ncbi:substrate-binding periplasmic protein [Vibrio galatheae]|uniref:substrate-binding periplasmic protein n=1 Tax=Vibrio galatheae TaxID=579748 RepID=UPI0006974A11|nr:transporter substrate-binding domain-containing protein [Vibrio galatheae]
MRYLFFILFLSLSSSSSYAQPTKTITLAYSDVESFPFQMGNGESVSTPPGLSIDVIKQVAEQLNINVEYVRLPGKRVLSQIRANQVDGGFIFSYSTERAQYANYPMDSQHADSTMRIATLDYFFYKLKDQTLAWDGVALQSIGDVPIGAHGGFSIAKKLKENQVNTIEIESTGKLFEMLSKKRLAAIAIQSNIANSYIDENNLTNIERVTPPISTKDYYLIFGHKFTDENPELVRRVWQVTSEVRDEVMAHSMKKYLTPER